MYTVFSGYNKISASTKSKSAIYSLATVEWINTQVVQSHGYKRDSTIFHYPHNYDYPPYILNIVAYNRITSFSTSSNVMKTNKHFCVWEENKLFQL